MKNKNLIRIFALALALLLCLSLLPMAALADGGEEDAIVFEDPTGDDPADEPGDPAGSGDAPEDAPQGGALGGAADDILLAEPDPVPQADALTGTVVVSLRTYDEEKEQYVYTPVTTAEVGDELYAAGEGCNNSGTLYYKWQRDGVNIPGAEGQLYTVTEDDEGTAIICFVISDVETGAISSAAVRVPKPETEPDPNPAPETGVVRIYKTEDNTDTGEKMVIEPELGKEYTLPECAFTREGFTFTGYNTAADGSGTAYKVGDPYTLTEENPTLELYAQWQENAPETVTVTFDANGGTGTMEAQTMNKGEETALNKNTFTRPNYRFNGWRSSTGSKNYADGETVVFNTNMTLRAQWVIKDEGPAAPENLTVDKKLINDGEIQKASVTGVTDEMEYTFSDSYSVASDAIWTPCKGTAVDDLTEPGYYYFRYKETETTRAGSFTRIRVDAFYTVEVEVATGARTGYVDCYGTEKYAENIYLYRNESLLGLDYHPATDYWVKKITINDVDSNPSKPYSVTEPLKIKVYFAVALRGELVITPTTVGVGGTLEAKVSDSNNTGTLTFTWLRNNEVIDGATGETYVTVPEDADKHITCEARSSVEAGLIISTNDAFVSSEPVSALTGTVTLSGDAVVGETLTAMVSGSNNTGTLSYQWQRDGKDIEGATASTYELTDDDAEKAISCVVTSDKETGSIASEAVTVQKANPVKVTLGGKAILDQTLTTTVTGMPEGKTPVYQWTRDGEDIEGADKASYTLTDADAGKAIRCVVTDAEKSFTAVSDPVTPAARPAAPTGVTVQQHIVNDADASLGGHIGRITGLNSTMQVAVSAEGPWSSVPSTSGSFTTKNPYTYYIRYKATDSAPASQPLTLEVKNFVTTVKELSSAEAKKYKYDITLSEKDRQGELSPAATDPGEAVAFLIPYPTGVSKDSNYLTLVHDTDGKSIEITQQDNGILGKSESFSSFTLTVGDMAPLTGTVAITGDPYVGETLTAELKDTNNTGVLSYQWTRDGVNIAGATATKYALTGDDLGKKIACVVTSSVQPGSVKSAELTVKATEIKVTQLLINDGDPEIPISQPARIIGVTTDMEFSLNNGEWMPVEEVPFDVNLPGTYTFRDKATKAELGSAKVTAYYTIWVNVKGTGGTVTAKATGGTLIPYPEVDENTWLIEQGDTVTLTFLPYRTTHTVTYLTVDGTAVTRSKTLQLRGVQKPHVIAVTFGDSRSSPRTGDTSNLGLWSALGMTSLAALAAIFVLQRRRRDA